MCDILFEKVSFKLVFTVDFSGAWGRPTGGVDTMSFLPSALNVPVKSIFLVYIFCTSREGAAEGVGRAAQ